MEPAELEASIAHARQLVYGREGQAGSLGEAARTDRMRGLDEAEEVVRVVLASDPENADALVLFAELASRRDNWDDAILRWNDVIQRAPGRESLAYLMLAEAYRSTGSFHRARQAIQRVKPVEVDRDDLLVAKRKLGARENEVAARIIGNRYVRTLLKTDEDEHSRALLDAALVLRNDADHVANAISDVADSIAGLRRSRPRWHRRLPGAISSSTPSPRCAFVSGFGWSGSGAVYDYFIQSSVATTPFGRAEVLAFERNWSAKKLLGALDQGPAAATTALTQFIFQGVLGVGGPLSIEADKNKRKTIMNFLRHNPTESTALSEACARLYASATEAIKAERATGIEEALRTFFDTVMALKVSPDEVGLMGNCIHATNVDLVRLVSNARAFVVFRDPRDQYVSQVYEHKDRHRMTVEGFVADYKRRMERYQRAVSASGDQAKIVPVQFEDFILSGKVRHQISEEMGIPESSLVIGEGGYRPEDSVKNVGIYKSYSNGEEIEAIQRDLGDYVFDS